jgi:hypothetical protein
MTLQIRSTDAICGIPIKNVRGFFRHVVSWHQHSFELPWLEEQLSLDKESALALATELENQGYVNHRRTACTPSRIRVRNWFVPRPLVKLVGRRRRMR